MEYKDYYNILGVGKNATQDEIRKQYRKLAAKYHPDRNQDDPGAQKKFTDVGEAYEVLKDPEKRKLYDQAGADWKRYQQAGAGDGSFDWSRYANQGRSYRVRMDYDPFAGGAAAGSAGSGSFSSFFETLFGGGDPFGQTRRAGGRQGRTAGAAGRGGRQNGDAEAPVDISLQELQSGVTRYLRINGERVKVNIPAGIEEGKRLKLKGKGKRRPDGSRGDLYLRVQIKPEKGYERKGSDLYYELPLDLYTAILGGETHVPVPGGKVKLTIPPDTQGGTLFRIPEHGLPDPQKSGKKGDFYARVTIRIPEKLSEKERELLRELAGRKKSQ